MSTDQQTQAPAVLDVHDVPDHSQYEGRIDGTLAGAVQYHRFPDAVALMHTEVSTSHTGQGLGAALVRAVLDDLRAQGVPVRPHCEFIRGWLTRHPEYQDLVAAD